MSSTSCMLRMSWMSWPRLQPRRRLLVAATSAPRASFVPRPCSCCYTVPMCVLSIRLSLLLCGCVQTRRTTEDARRKGRMQTAMQPDKRNRTFPCPGPRNSSQLFGASWCSNIVATCFCSSLFLHSKTCEPLSSELQSHSTVCFCLIFFRYYNILLTLIRSKCDYRKNKMWNHFLKHIPRYFSLCIYTDLFCFSSSSRFGHRCWLLGERCWAAKNG